MFRGDSLRVVGCYSKLFSHTDSLKSIHFKETYAMVLAFDHFKAYLLNTQKSVIVFTWDNFRSILTAEALHLQKEALITDEVRHANPYDDSSFAS